MDEQTMQQIREALLARWRRPSSSLEEEMQLSAEMNQPQSEMIDIAQALEQIGRNASLAEAERRELVAIERALGKMSSGGFGICEDCGEEIPVKRLMVVPEARLCAGCQAFEEKTRRGTAQRAG
jgi:DnaK suppressor protein